MLSFVIPEGNPSSLNWPSWHGQIAFGNDKSENVHLPMNNKVINRYILLPLLILAFCQPLHSTILYVNANVQGGNQDGTSWADAYPLLQSAIIAAQYGDTIWVAQGTYYPTTGTNRNVSFLLKNGVRLFGGFAGVETALSERDWELNETILSGDIGVAGDSTDNSYNVVYCEFADSTTILDGFVITGGNADSQVSGSTYSRPKSGGGLYLVGSSQTEDTRPVITNCRFIGNHARYNGGGMFIRTVSGAGATPILKNCNFQDNTSFKGGGIYKVGGSLNNEMAFEGCNFIQNSAQYGGGLNFYNNNGIKTVRVQDCNFFGNYSQLTGGGMYYEASNSSSKLEITKCNFQQNLSDGEGSAASNYYFIFSEVRIDSCIFHKNKTQADGTIYLNGEGLTELINSSFVSNSAIDSTGAVGNGGCVKLFNGKLIALNCLFVKSNAPQGGVANIAAQVEITFYSCSFISNSSSTVGLVYASPVTPNFINLFNSVIWNNDSNQLNQQIENSNSSGETMLSHCIIDSPNCTSIAYGSVTCGSGMLYMQDPLFADTAAGDFTLLPCSPAIDAGDNAIVDSLGITTDLAGNPRIQGGTVDMGAYESPAFNVDTFLITQPSCGGAEGAVQFQLAHGCSPFSYDWTSGTNSGTGTTGLSPGNYSFTITDALGKLVEAQVEILEVPAVTATANAVPYSCSTDTGGTASIIATGGTGPFEYLWDSGSMESTLADLSPGTYAVTVTDANGCTYSDTVAVETTGHLTLSINVTPTNCHDSNDGTAAVTPLGGTAPFAWLWQDDQTDSLLTGLGGGSWSVTVTDALGCTGDVQFSMTAPDTLVAEATGTDVLCAGQATGTASVTATGGTGAYEYDWSNAKTTPTINQLLPGWYYVTVTDVNQCSDTAGVFIASPPALGVAVEATQRLCFGENDGTAAALASGGTPPYSFEWETGQTDSLLTGLPPGSYAVTVTDGNGCTGEATAVIDSSAQIQALFEITHATGAANADGGVEVSLVFGGTPGYEFLWSNGAVTQSLENVLPGPYSLTVTDADSCQNVFYFTVDVENAAGEEQAVPFRTVIVPNPSGTGGAELWLEATQPQMLAVQVFDGLGRVLFSKEAFATAGENRWDLPLPMAIGMPPGVYRVVVRNGGGAVRVLMWVVM
jgi:SprB repeat